MAERDCTKEIAELNEIVAKYDNIVLFGYWGVWAFTVVWGFSPWEFLEIFIVHTKIMSGFKAYPLCPKPLGLQNS